MKRNRLILTLVCLISIIVGSFCACNGGGNGFDVIFDLNGGTLISGETEQTVNSADEITVPSVAKTGYVFVGWDKDVSAIDKATTVTAQWEACAYTITYNLAGGFGATDNPSTYTIESDDITLLSPEREGFVFAGWTASDSFTPVIDYVLKKGSYGNKEFTAVWTPKYFTITFDANGGTGIMYSISVKAGERRKLPQATFEKAGYVVAGWAYTPDGEISVTDGGEFLQPANDVKLYAIWEGRLSYYTVEYYKENDNGEFVLAQRERLSGKAFETAETTAKIFEGYRFYAGKSTATGTIRPDDSLVLKLYYEKEIVISFDANGGSGTMDNQVLVFSSENKNLKLNAFVKSGYVFKGWSLKKDGITEYADGALYDKRSGVTLYAVWSVNNTVTVNFDLSGGTFNGHTEIEPVTIIYGGTLGFELFTPEKSGYAFVEWRAGDKKITADTPLNVGEEITLTAVYIKKFVIKYQLVCTVYYRQEADKPRVSEEVSCEYEGNLTIPDEIIVSGGKISIDISKFKVVKYQKQDFGFSGLYVTINDKLVKVTEDTVFDVETFGEANEITLKVRCKYLYTPNY